MAEDPRTYQPSTTSVNRGRMQGLGVGQQEMDMQQDPNRELHATDPQNTEGWDNDPPNQATDRPAEADFSGQDVGEQERSFASDQEPGAALDDRNAAGLDQAGDLGAGTPANVDIHKAGQDDNPEAEWGDPADEGAVFSANHTRRPVKTEADRGQGAKTRQANKDIISRRS